MKIGIDVDETVAMLHEPWITWLERKWGAKGLRQRGGFSYWDEPTDLYGKESMAFIHPLVYDCDVVRPYRYAQLATQMLRDHGATILWVTSCINDTEAAKWRWLDRHDFLRREDTFVPITHGSKNIAGMDLLIDDAVHYANTFHGPTFLINRLHNKREPWTGLRFDSLYDAAKAISYANALSVDDSTSIAPRAPESLPALPT